MDAKWKCGVIKWMVRVAGRRKTLMKNRGQDRWVVSQGKWEGRRSKEGKKSRELAVELRQENVKGVELEGNHAF